VKAAQILSAALFTWIVCLRLGQLILRAIPLKPPPLAERFLSFLLGSAVLSLSVFLLSVLKLAYLAVFLVLGILVLAASLILRLPFPATGKLELPSAWLWIWRSVFSIYTVLYVVCALALIDNFLRQTGYRFPVLLARHYVDTVIDSLSIPRSWIVDSTGRIVKHQIGRDIAPDWIERTLRELSAVPRP